MPREANAHAAELEVGEDLAFLATLRPDHGSEMGPIGDRPRRNNRWPLEEERSPGDRADLDGEAAFARLEEVRECRADAAEQQSCPRWAERALEGRQQQHVDGLVAHRIPGIQPLGLRDPLLALHILGPCIAHHGARRVECFAGAVALEETQPQGVQHVETEAQQEVADALAEMAVLEGMDPEHRHLKNVLAHPSEFLALVELERAAGNEVRIFDCAADLDDRVLFFLHCLLGVLGDGAHFLAFGRPVHRHGEFLPREPRFLGRVAVHEIILRTDFLIGVDWLGRCQRIEVAG